MNNTTLLSIIKAFFLFVSGESLDDESLPTLTKKPTNTDSDSEPANEGGSSESEDQTGAGINEKQKVNNSKYDQEPEAELNMSYSQINTNVAETQKNDKDNDHPDPINVFETHTLPNQELPATLEEQKNDTYLDLRGYETVLINSQLNTDDLGVNVIPSEILVNIRPSVKHNVFDSVSPDANILDTDTLDANIPDVKVFKNKPLPFQINEHEQVNQELSSTFEEQKNDNNDDHLEHINELEIHTPANQELSAKLLGQEGDLGLDIGDDMEADSSEEDNRDHERERETFILANVNRLNHDINSKFSHLKIKVKHISEQEERLIGLVETQSLALETKIFLVSKLNKDYQKLIIDYKEHNSNLENLYLELEKANSARKSFNEQVLQISLNSYKKLGYSLHNTATTDAKINEALEKKIDKYAALLTQQNLSYAELNSEAESWEEKTIASNLIEESNAVILDMKKVITLANNINEIRSETSKEINELLHKAANIGNETLSFWEDLKRMNENELTLLKETLREHRTPCKLRIDPDAIRLGEKVPLDSVRSLSNKLDSMVDSFNNLRFNEKSALQNDWKHINDKIKELELIR
jgi:hypothetical protein